MKFFPAIEAIKGMLAMQSEPPIPSQPRLVALNRRDVERLVADYEKMRRALGHLALVMEPKCSMNPKAKVDSPFSDKLIWNTQAYAESILRDIDTL